MLCYVNYKPKNIPHPLVTKKYKVKLLRIEKFNFISKLMWQAFLSYCKYNIIP